MSGEKCEKNSCMTECALSAIYCILQEFIFFAHLNNKLLLQKITLTLILGPGSAVKKYFFQDYEKRENFFYMDAYTGLQYMQGSKREFSTKAQT